MHLLWFAPNGADNDDDSLLIGVYESETAAREAIKRLDKKPGFAEFPQGFQIHTRELGQDHWTEGFIND